MPVSSGQTREAKPSSFSHSQISVEGVPETHVAPWAHLAEEAWCPLEIKLKIWQVLDLKSFNKSSTVLSSISVAHIEFAVFSCSYIHTTPHSSPVCAPHEVPQNLLSSSALGSLTISKQFGFAQIPCSPATSFGSMCRFCQARNTSEQHICLTVKLSPAS